MDDASWACDCSYFAEVDHIQVFALVFLGYCDIAFLKELNNASVEFEWLLDCELLTLFCKKVSFFQMLLFCVHKDSIGQEENVINLKANNAKVVGGVAL